MFTLRTFSKRCRGEEPIKSGASAAIVEGLDTEPSDSKEYDNVSMLCSESNKIAKSNPQAPLYQLTEPELPFQQIAADYFQMGGRNYVVVVDRYSNWQMVSRAEQGVKGLKVMEVLEGEKAMAKRHVAMHEACDEHRKKLLPLKIGVGYSLRFRQGTILDVWKGQLLLWKLKTYCVRIDGTGRRALRISWSFENDRKKLCPTSTNRGQEIGLCAWFLLNFLFLQPLSTHQLLIVTSPNPMWMCLTQFKSCPRLCSGRQYYEDNWG